MALLVDGLPLLVLTSAEERRWLHGINGLHWFQGELQKSFRLWLTEKSSIDANL